ncbi:MAG: outer membrane beta-barrel protein, partial [Pseudomonadota bacterium]
NSNLSVNALNVMNAAYSMHTSYGLGFMIGKFESPVGHETYNHMDNSQFTRSYGFNLAPFFSTGLMVHYGQDMWEVGLIASNGAGRDFDTNDKNKTLGLTVDVNPMDNLSIDLNYVTGTENVGGGDYSTNTLDFSVEYMINEMFDVALNYISLAQEASTPGATEEEGTSIAAYVNANFGMFGLGLRYEQFDFDDQLATYNAGGTLPAVPTGEDNSIASITLAAKAEIDQNAMVLLEYRQDTADDNGTWTDKDGQATDSLSTITASVMYRF